MSVAKANVVYVIEPAVSVATAVKLIGIDAHGRGNIRIFCANRLRQAELAAKILASDLPYELLAFESVGGEYDDIVYGYCQALAKRYSSYIAEEWRWAHFVSLQDRLVAALRGPYILKRLLAIGGSCEVVVICSPRGPDRGTWKLFSSAFRGSLRTLGGKAPLSNPAQEVLDALHRVGVRKYDEAAIDVVARKGPRRRLCISVAAANPQYVGAAVPLLERLVDSYDLLVANASPHSTVREVLTGQLEPGVNAEGRLDYIDLVAGKAPNATLLDVIRMGDLARKAHKSADESHPLDEIFGPALHELALRDCARVESAIKVLWGQAQKLVSCVDGVVVVPGRHMHSNVLIAAAHAVGKPTFDVQTGTITRTRRFLAPAAKIVFAMNDESARMFSSLGKNDGVLPIGSFKIDRDLAPYRTLEKAAARSQLGLKPDGEVWVFASQPVGVSTMITVVQVVCDAAAARGGVTVLIKMHPNETSPYRRAYEDLRTRYEIPIIVDQETKSAIVIVTADAVFTHFSSVAIEAYALGRPAIAVNPFNEPLPFDLGASGIAPEVSSYEQIVPVLENFSGNRGSMDVLRDGQALDRAMEVIENLMNPGKQQKARRSMTRRYYSRLPLSLRLKLSPIARPIALLLNL